MHHHWNIESLQGICEIGTHAGCDLSLENYIWSSTFGGCDVSLEHYYIIAAHILDDLSLNILFTAAALPSSYIIPIPEKKYTWQATQAGCPSLKHMILCRNYTIMCFIAPLSCFAWLHYSSSLTVSSSRSGWPIYIWYTASEFHQTMHQSWWCWINKFHFAADESAHC